MGNNFFTLGSLFFSIMIIIVYFSKKRVSNSEIQQYKRLIITNLLIGIFASISYYFIKYFPNLIFTDILNKSLLASYITWMFFFTLYLFEISEKFKNRKNNLNNIYRTCSYIIYIFGMVLIYILPINYVNDNNIIYSYGFSTNMLYILSAICVIVWLISILINYKTISIKYFPLFVILLIGSIVVVIQHFHPELLLITYMFSYVTCLMYFTIENPDVKMLEQVEIAKDQAEKSNRAKSDFLSSMSHEIRTPLNAIVGFSEDIERHKDSCSPEVVEDAEYILQASNQLLDIVGNILDINKIESNKMELTLTDYNIREEIDSLANINRVRIGEKNINFTYDISDNIPYTLNGDIVHIKQIINNLLSNAIKYTDSGSISLVVNSSCDNDICNLVIGVKDTGKGIKEEDMKKLFTKFERLDTIINSTIEGTGLGLVITKSLVEMMGGEIKVESVYGEGSLFTVTIPQKIVDNDKPLSDTQILNSLEISNAIESFNNKKVLIVDDNKLNIKVARRALDSFNLILDECYNGEECLNKINSGEKYDLILMDIMMPVMNGEETIAKLKEIESFNTPVIALTADALKGAEEKYKNEGFCDYISKPFNKDGIKEKLDLVFSTDHKWDNVPVYNITNKKEDTEIL